MTIRVTYLFIIDRAVFKNNNLKCPNSLLFNQVVPCTTRCQKVGSFQKTWVFEGNI
jgi:hypothetical protein